MWRIGTNEYFTRILEGQAHAYFKEHGSGIKAVIDGAKNSERIQVHTDRTGHGEGGGTENICHTGTDTDLDWVKVEHEEGVRLTPKTGSTRSVVKNPPLGVDQDNRQSVNTNG